MDQLILLPEQEAIRSFFDTLNCKALFRLLAICALVAVGLLVWIGVDGRWTDLILPAFNLVLIRALFLSQEREIFAENFRLILIGFVIVQGVIWRFSLPGEMAGFHPIDFLLPFLLLLFRLPSDQLTIPLGAFWAWSVGRNLVESILRADIEPAIGPLLLQSAISLTVFAAVRHWTADRHSAFLADWRRESRRDQDRRRMREELDDARRIQLSMLPRAEPAMGWLQAAGISIPASEVGGDYYGYFRFSDHRLAITVADVAGHGVASGLVLSGVRAGLHLLREASPEPLEVMRRLDQMVRETSGTRMFVAMVYAVFERDGRVTFCSAGNPPVLHCRPGSGEAREILHPALPLGTRLHRDLEQHSFTMERGDVVILYSDGISETLNASGEAYSAQRMRQCVAALPDDLDARAIRDRLLSDVWSFKADGEQIDDITIVVARRV